MRTKALLVSAVLAIAAGLATAAHAQDQKQTQDRKINVEGCVRPGPGGSYVLTDLKVIAASPGVDDSADRTYTLAQVDPARLGALSGKRAGVSARVAGTDQAPRLDVISIVEAVGTCPAKAGGGS
jgi:hypothetical protein